MSWAARSTAPLTANTHCLSFPVCLQCYQFAVRCMVNALTCSTGHQYNQACLNFLVAVGGVLEKADFPPTRLWRYDFINFVSLCQYIELNSVVINCPVKLTMGLHIMSIAVKAFWPHGHRRNETRVTKIVCLVFSQLETLSYSAEEYYLVYQVRADGLRAVGQRQSGWQSPLRRRYLAWQPCESLSSGTFSLNGNSMLSVMNTLVVFNWSCLDFVSV